MTLGFAIYVQFLLKTYILIRTIVVQGREHFQMARLPHFRAVSRHLCVHGTVLLRAGQDSRPSRQDECWEGAQ
jgi:hypothetical protein